GPLVIRSLLVESPHIARGAILFSPGFETPLHPLGLLYQQRVKSGEMGLFFASKGIVDDPVSDQWLYEIEGQMVSDEAKQSLTSDIPVKVIAGDLDVWSTPDLVWKFAEDFPNRDVEIITGADHHINDARGEHESRMVEMTIEFISEVLKTPLEPRRVS